MAFLITEIRPETHLLEDEARLILVSSCQGRDPGEELRSHSLHLSLSWNLEVCLRRKYGSGPVEVGICRRVHLVGCRGVRGRLSSSEFRQHSLKNLCLLSHHIVQVWWVTLSDFTSSTRSLIYYEITNKLIWRRPVVLKRGPEDYDEVSS